MRKSVIFIVLAVILALMATTVLAAPPPGGPPGLERAITAQEKHNPNLLSTDGVVATAVGVAKDGKFAIKVFTDRPGRLSLPAYLDDVQVDVEMTGKFRLTGAACRKGKGL